jgi:hypothetical protein
MSFQVFTGGGGLPGWALLNRTGDRQRELVGNDPQVRRATEYYRDKIGEISSADDLLSDFRLLNVTLQTFGLENDIRNRAFLRKILESDLSDDRSLANRLADKSYRKLAETFGFGDLTGPKNGEAGFSDKILAQYVEREFEARVGEGDQNLRLALNARRELATLSGRASTNNTKWYEVMGNQPLRKVFEGAFGFDRSYAKLPIDRQLQEFARAAELHFGSDQVSQFSDTGKVDELVRSFLARSALQQNAATSRFSVALTLLGGG